MKKLALKSKKVEESSRVEKDNDDEENLFIMVLRGLSHIMKMRRKFKVL